MRHRRAVFALNDRYLVDEDPLDRFDWPYVPSERDAFALSPAGH